jgi:hypothetical protein
LSRVCRRRYVAEVLLFPFAGDGTEMRWQATFEATVSGTGWVVKRLLRGAIIQGANALAR